MISGLPGALNKIFCSLVRLVIALCTSIITRPAAYQGGIEEHDQAPKTIEGRQVKGEDGLHIRPSSVK